MSTTLNPYLTFNGSTKEAMEFYRSVLGGELSMQTFGESGMPVAEEYKNHIVHAQLKSDAILFMASDGGDHKKVTMGDNISLSLVGSDEATLRKYFDGLAAGGKVTMPLAKQFWGDTFGMLTDKFGINWMVNISAAHPPAEQK